jgi:hypothetical protein
MEEPNIINNNNNNNNNHTLPPSPSLFPVLNTNAEPQYFVQLDSTLKVGECVNFDYNGSSKFGRIIDYDNDDKDDKNVIINEYIIPQQGSRHVVRNLIRNIQLVQQTHIEHAMDYNTILDYCWIITTTDVDQHSITIGENYKNFYGVTHRINTVTSEVSLIDYKNGLVSNSVTEDIFLDLNLLRDQITRKINTRSTLQATRFTIQSACSRHTKNYFIRNLSTPVLEFNIRRACPRTGAQLAQYNNPIKYLEYILRLDSKVDLANVNELLGGGCLVGIRRQFPRMMTTNTVIGNDSMLHCVLGLDNRSGIVSRYRYDRPRGSIDLSFFSNRNIIVYKCRYTAKPYSTLTATERTELKLEAPVRNVLLNDICYYNNSWYTIVHRSDNSNKLDLKTISGGIILKEVSIDDVQFRDGH